MENQPHSLPKQFKNLTGMGPVIQIFEPKVAMTVRLILSTIFFLAGGGAIAYALYILWQRWGRYYPPAILKDIAPWLIGALLAFIFTAGLMWGLIRRRKKGAVVFNNGFAYSDHKGVQTWRWEQVADITANVVRHYTNGIYTGTTHTYTLVKANGDKLVINDSIREVEALYTHLQNNTLQHRYQRMADEYNQGNPVTFGPVTIGKQTGIQIGKKSYSWDQIEEVGINKGVLSVKKKDGKWFSGASATAGSIPNLHVLLSIINQIVGLKTAQ